MTPEILLDALTEAGYRREDPVTAPGQVARRGGILDVHPPGRPRPVRVEFLGDTVESLREFDPETQRSTGTLSRLQTSPLADLFVTRSVAARLREILPGRPAARSVLDPALERLRRGPWSDELGELVCLVPGATVPAWEHLPQALVVALEPEEGLRAAEEVLDGAAEEARRQPEGLAPTPGEAYVGLPALRGLLERPPWLALRALGRDGEKTELPCRPPARYHGDLRRLVDDLRRSAGRTVVFLGSAGRAERVREVLREAGLGLGEEGSVEVRVGALTGGFELPTLGLRVLADGDVFPEEVHLHPAGRRARRFFSDFRDLAPGDLVVHQEHGIGRFEGLETLTVAGQPGDFMVLGFQGGDKLKVPVDAFDRVQKYAATEDARPPLDRLGSGHWEKVKRRVKRAMRDMAEELLRLYAERKALAGHAFAAEGPWLREFEEAFAYDETPDQAAAIADVARDMAHPAPMDRLVCGDVGYGKTEVAMRAAMRAVLDGKQVAVLAPTTVLAFQHAQTFAARFAPFPVAIEMVSRFRSPAEIKDALRRLAAGRVDILIGTHRLLSRDVVFKDLGLLVVDEEQRFGVAAKEKLKTLRAGVDCLTLSATPIPRTLQMGLSGIRDMSVIETPPRDRLAIHTSVVKFSTDTIATAIRQELSREGQVFFLHNRVESIHAAAALVRRLVPEARVAVAHGQMPEAVLEKTMLAFVEGRADVLVATTLIENGLDIPRANTLIVNRADRFGLSQLYQLRGRVGRSDRRAHALLLVPPDTVLSEVARKRLAAMRDFSDLGAGFRIAALDLELRGAGNILGGQQSGHLHAVGLDLYLKLLDQTIRELRGQPVREAPRAVLNLRLGVRLGEDYVPDVDQRLALYKRASQVRTAEEVEALRAEVRDRYGPLPTAADRLFACARLRLLAEGMGVEEVDLAGPDLRVRFGAASLERAAALLEAPARLPGASFAPPASLRVPLGVLGAGDPLAALAALLDRLAAGGL
jgi:transcription-repair coupling factor (superfamily II helicase)